MKIINGLKLGSYDDNSYWFTRFSFIFYSIVYIFNQGICYKECS